MSRLTLHSLPDAPAWTLSPLPGDAPPPAAAADARPRPALLDDGAPGRAAPAAAGSEEAAEAAGAPGAPGAAPEGREIVFGCGWFDSSFELRQGLLVCELGPEAPIPHDVPLAWLLQ